MNAIIFSDCQNPAQKVGKVVKVKIQLLK